MEQQDAKNLILMEDFLSSVEDIIKNYKKSVDRLNEKIENVSHVNERLDKVENSIKTINNELININKTIKAVEQKTKNPKNEELKGVKETLSDMNTWLVSIRNKIALDESSKELESNVQLINVLNTMNALIDKAYNAGNEKFIATSKTIAKLSDIPNDLLTACYGINKFYEIKLNDKVIEARRLNADAYNLNKFEMEFILKSKSDEKEASNEATPKKKVVIK